MALLPIYIYTHTYTHTCMPACMHTCTYTYNDNITNTETRSSGLSHKRILGWIIQICFQRRLGQDLLEAEIQEWENRVPNMLRHDTKF